MAADLHPTASGPSYLLPLPHPPSSAATPVDSLTCQWLHCGHHALSPEALYEHVCERHVGRKSTNNLTLQCQWASCRVTTVKRDHITSHIRVHISLKPHKCHVCHKAFKRPQDLKKHVKTHADGSVLLDSPQRPIHDGPSAPEYHSSTHSYYAEHPVSLNAHSNPNQVYVGNRHSSLHTHHPDSHYTPVYVPQAQNGYNGSAQVESSRHSVSALNDFFGEVKRRRIDPSNYHDLGARFAAYSNLLLPSFGATLHDYDSTFQTSYQPSNAGFPDQIPGSTSQLDRPFTELKTKDDLMSVDSFLEALQRTVYESSSTLTGTDALPSTESHHPKLNVRTAQPPTMYHNSATSQHADTYSATSLAPPAVDDTPALTPSSYASNSPTHSQHNSTSPMPSSARQTGTINYPTLPSANTFSPASSRFAFSEWHSGVLVSTLGSSCDEYDGRRRFFGGTLQQAAPLASPAAFEVTSPPDSRRGSAERATQLRNGVRKVDLSSLSTRRRSSSTTSGDERQEAWVENMRTIEMLRHYLRTRLEKGQYENGNDEGEVQSGQSKPGGSAAGRGFAQYAEEPAARWSKNTDGVSYPLLKAVETPS